MSEKSISQAVARIQNLSALGLNGKQIARVLRNDSYDINVVSTAFLSLNYVVHIGPFTADFQELHISNQPNHLNFDDPMSAIAILVQSKAPQAMPTVVWKIPSTVQQLLDLENDMTLMAPFEEHPGAKAAFDAIYLDYGLPGIEAVFLAGYHSPDRLYTIWNDVCHRSVPELARRLDLK